MTKKLLNKDKFCLKKENCVDLNFPSELRFDLISQDWVVIATGRSRRPDTYKKDRKKEEEVPPDKCLFCKIETQKKPVLIYAKGKKVSNETIPSDWTNIVVPNLYPAFIPRPEIKKKMEGPFYQTINAVGFHEVVITRDHKKAIGEFSLEEIKELIDVYQDRYLDLMKKDFVHYVSIFHNHGLEAGASIAHPHSQIITTPLIDVDLNKALINSKAYNKKTGKCIYCQASKWEAKVKTRVIFENKEFLAICPFASKSAFEIIITPKKHQSCFERVKEEDKWQLAEAFKDVFGKLYRGLVDPAYNFYLHTAPCDGKDYPYYHWHWTILPKTSTWAGFEMSTGIEISTIAPEKAAAYLKEQ